jgi:hypothetical protein
MESVQRFFIFVTGVSGVSALDTITHIPCPTTACSYVVLLIDRNYVGLKAARTNFSESGRAADAEAAVWL